MAVTINASTSDGLVTSADTSGDLNIQSGGSTKIAVTSAGVAVTGLSKASLPTGSVLQVVNAVYSTETGTSTNTYADTGITATITPTSASSKILVSISISGMNGRNDGGIMFSLVRNGTTISSGIGYYTGQIPGASAGAYLTVAGPTLSYLDSPATTSAIPYKVQFKTNSTAGANYIQFGGAPSSITLMEIAA